MDIHHAMIVRNQPERLYEALTQQRDLEVWMDAPTTAKPEVGSRIEFQYDQGQRTLKMEIIALEENKRVKWRAIRPFWSNDTVQQVITWTLIPYESNTLVDFRMEGWTQDSDTYASLSYKWASFMMRLKIYMGDTREIASLYPTMRTINSNKKDSV
jgi:uncharacterized protein YndB with AHSA1/START domain